jgi:hypothetical protein
MGAKMVAFIQAHVDSSAAGAVKEVGRFRAFFDFLRASPEFPRILNEAEIFAPNGYQRHLDNIATAYVRILKRDRDASRVDDYSDSELEAIVHIFMGARGYLSRRYAYAEGSAQSVPEHVISAYEKLLTRGLFTPSGGEGGDA